MQTLFAGGQVYTREGILNEGWLLVQDGLIKAFGTADNEPPVSHIVPLAGRALLPGFINIHVHGSCGADTMDAKLASIETMSRFEAAHGVTAFLHTTMTASHKATLDAIQTVQQMMRQCSGARPLGAHMEGPYLNVNKAGAQAIEHMRAPAGQSYDELLESGCVRLITVAPELDGALQLIRAAKERGITASVGHSLASLEQMQQAIEAGISHVTHLFNGMPGFHHRTPGIIGAALTNSGLSVEVIADLVHLHPVALNIALKTKPSDKLVLVTDAMRAAGMPDGSYDLGGQQVCVQGGIARLEDGTLAGSTLSLDRAVSNIMQALSIPLEQAVQLASANPAKAIGIHAHKGSIAPGMDADLVIWDHGTVELTMVEGDIVYQRSS